MSTEAVVTEQVELTESDSAPVSAVANEPAEATPVSTAPSSLMMPTFTPEMPAVQLRVDEQDINALFDELDFDKSNSLDTQEFKAFVLGRFNLPVEYVNSIFEKYDKDGSKTIDRNEFNEVVAKFNSILQSFDTAEEKYLMGQMYKLAGIGYFMMCCCLCTVGTSFCCGSCCSVSVLKGVVERQETKQTRLAKAVAVESMAGR